MHLLLTLGLLLALAKPPTTEAVGQPVDIAPSAYQFRADRRPDANPPESWFALMHAANLPLNQPVDLNNPAIKSALCGLLWEEIRPVQTLELTWPASAKHRPGPGDLGVSALINQGASSSWWNNLNAISQHITPTVSNGGNTYTYAIGQNTCGLVLSLANGGDAKRYDVPQVRALVPDTWKQMDLELEWGFDPKTAAKDYSGRLEAYDGRIANLQPLQDDPQTSTTDLASWRSEGRSPTRRGVKLSLLYMGASKWRKQQQYTTQADDVARTIVTVWTKSGNFSFLAADLENGPILAPEYGFFVRRTSLLAPPSPQAPLRVSPTPLTTPMNEIAGDGRLKGWGSNETPWFGGNPTDNPITVKGIAFPAHSVALHPGQFVDVVAQWRSPIQGKVRLDARLTHAQAGGKGIEWWLAHDSPAGREILAHGTTDGAGATGTNQSEIPVQPGDLLSLIVGPKGDHRSCTMTLDWTIKQNGAYVAWNLANDLPTVLPHGNPYPDDPGNPHPDGLGNVNTWRFGSEMPMFRPAGLPSQPPIELASNAISAKAFVRELQARGLQTIRQQTRAHADQTWEAAVEATRGPNFPPIPAPPAGAETPMQVEVPSARLTAQWNLAAWHMLRHCATNPKTGRLWFNDFPYGILAAETYMVLHVLDLIGSPAAAADGYDQWLSLPLDRNPPGTDPARAIPEHPVGLFSEGHGALTNAVGPDGYGGQMDVIHAFGPGSIGWALTQHYWLTGDTQWLKASAPRIQANAEWMLRQRRVLSAAVPGGQRLWCKGLQPALQVTPDSGGLWMQFYECEGYYWASVSQLAETLAVVDPAAAAKLQTEAEAYRKDLRAAVERSIALSPVVPVRDGTFHSVIPFACYARGLSTGAWGWQRDGSGSHVGPLYWDTVQTAAALVSPAGLLPAQDPRVQGYLDVLEDRLLLENQNVGARNWFFAGWQYQGGLERTPNMHLAADDVPVFLRSFLNCYAVDVLPDQGYVFNEHAVHGPPDKIFEEAAFLERFRNLLVMEEGQTLWLARATPRAWLAPGNRIRVRRAPTRFGAVDYEILADAATGNLTVTLSLPTRNPPKEILLRLRRPGATPITAVTVNGKPWKDFDAAGEVLKLHGLTGAVRVEVRY